jgi:hypothetical protein
MRRGADESASGLAAALIRGSADERWSQRVGEEEGDAERYRDLRLCPEGCAGRLRRDGDTFLRRRREGDAGRGGAGALAGARLMAIRRDRRGRVMAVLFRRGVVLGVPLRSVFRVRGLAGHPRMVGTPVLPQRFPSPREEEEDGGDERGESVRKPTGHGASRTGQLT